MKPATESGWPPWARIAASVAIGLQLASVLAAELRFPPSSPLAAALASPFQRYYEMTNQGFAHRYYGDIGPTPIFTAELTFGDGRPAQTLRVPDRSTRPRLVYQRQLALANALFEEGMRNQDRDEGERDRSLATSFARHLALTHPGCTSVALRLQVHKVPDVGWLIDQSRRGPVDLDSKEFYSRPEWIGEFPCPTR